MDARTSAAWAAGVTIAFVAVGWYFGGAAFLSGLLPFVGAAALFIGILLNLRSIRLWKEAQRRRYPEIGAARRVQEAPHPLLSPPRISELEPRGFAPESPVKAERSRGATRPIAAAPPGRLERYISLGQAHYARGEKARAIAILQRAAILYPDRKEPYRELAALYIRENDLEQAVEWVEQGIEQDVSLRRDILEDPLFDALRDEASTRERYERLLRFD